MCGIEHAQGNDEEVPPSARELIAVKSMHSRGKGSLPISGSHYRSGVENVTNNRFCNALMVGHVLPLIVTSAMLKLYYLIRL